jgi:hypothetical protein
MLFMLVADATAWVADVVVVDVAIDVIARYMLSNTALTDSS